MAIAIALLWGHFDDVSNDVGTRVDALEETLEDTATSLDDTADAAAGFSQTLTRTGAGLDEASGVVERLSPLLVQIGNVDVLGFRPLAQIAPLFEDVGGRLGRLAPRLTAITEELTVNQGQLERTSESVRELSTQLRELQAQLASGFLETRVDQGFGFLKIGVIALTIWLALPSAAALLIGIWLRRAVAPRPTDA